MGQIIGRNFVESPSAPIDINILFYLRKCESPISNFQLWLFIMSWQYMFFPQILCVLVCVGIITKKVAVMLFDIGNKICRPITIEMLSSKVMLQARKDERQTIKHWGQRMTWQLIGILGDNFRWQRRQFST